MSIIGQKVAYSRFLRENEELVRLADESPEILGFSVVPYTDQGETITQELIDGSRGFINPNRPTLLLHVSQNLQDTSQEKIREAIEHYNNKGIDLFTVKPDQRIASTFHYFKSSSS